VPSNEPGALRVRHVRAGEHQLLRELRLASLWSDPDAFGSTHAREAGYPAERWERWASDSEEGLVQRTFVLVDDDDRWLGLALARLDEDASGRAVLNAMWVAPKARGRGGAGLLCDACSDWAAARSCREIRLVVVVDNEVAQRAYATAGFTARGTTTWEREDRVLDELIMVRPLGDGAG